MHATAAPLPLPAATDLQVVETVETTLTLGKRHGGGTYIWMARRAQLRLSSRVKIQSVAVSNMHRNCETT